MQVVIVSCVYPPEPVVSARTSADLANSLQAIGHEVLVITNFPNRPAGKLYKGYQRRLWMKTTYENIPVLRCYSTLSPESTKVSRFLENLTFGLFSSLALLFVKKPDVIYANTWPVFAQGLICFVASIRRIPIILSIQDIYPESLAVQGRLSPSNIFYKILRWLDRANARMTSALVVISNHFARIYLADRGISLEKIYIIPNWFDPEIIQPVPKKQFRVKKGIPENSFVFCYAGNIGKAAGVENLIQAFSEINLPNVYLLIAGDGSHKDKCADLITHKGLKNVILHSPWLPEETSEVLSAADILVLPTSLNQSMVSVPSKLITYLFTGKPILAIVEETSEISNCIKLLNCGWVVSLKHIKILERTLLEILSLSEEKLTEMGRRGKKYAEENFSRENVQKIICLLETWGKL